MALDLTKLLEVLSTFPLQNAGTVARGIQKATGRGQLNNLGRGWSKSVMERMGFVVTKDTKPAEMFPRIRKN